MKTGERVVLRQVSNNLNGFTAYKVYEVLSGAGEKNISDCAFKHGTMVTHSERTFNVKDDSGHIRFVSDQYFRSFNSTLGLFK